MDTIFDIGSNNGDDIAYFLKKARRVVAFEANPELCRQIRSRFSQEIHDGRVVVLAGVLCAEKHVSGELCPFFIHRDDHLLSQFPEPRKPDNYTRVELPIVTLRSALCTYGLPGYAKIDVEHYDHSILEEFFRLGAFPDYVSAEYHAHEVCELLTGRPEYKGFKFVDACRIELKVYDTEIDTISGGTVRHSFPPHSSGPFGNDIGGAWYDRRSFLRKMEIERTGWKDIHASRIDVGHEIEVPVPLSHYAAVARNAVKNRVRPLVPARVRRLYRTLKTAL